MTIPKIRHLAPSPHGYVVADKLFCNASVRLSRRESTSDPGPALRYGQYFEAITDVISRDNYRLLVDATRRQLEKDVSLADIREISIYAEKHGSDYHPARIEAKVRDVCVPFVMNVAVTARGKDRLCREFGVLQHLNSKYDFSLLPQAYFQDESSHGSDLEGQADTHLLMFLADWFDGYHEFHLSVDKEDVPHKLVLWDTDKGQCPFSRLQAWQTYSQAARILTLYYDIETFEQIFPWHHAAGDFVVRAHRDSLDVRLVTARQYAPMMEPSEKVSVHEALLFFLLNLSVRMRLDRLDGVGEVAWADDECMDATLEGFLEGFRIKEREGMLGGMLVGPFIQHCACFDQEDLSDRFHALVNACDQAAPDIPVIRTHLDRHIAKFHKAVQSLKDS